MDELTVMRYAGPHGAWEQWVGTPSPALRGLVRRYSGFTEIRAAFPARRELPSLDVVMLVSLTGGFTIADPRSPGGPRRFGHMAAGVWDGYGLSSLDAGWSGIQVDLTPIGARLFLNVPMHEIANRMVDLESLLGPAGRDLVERLGNLDGWHERFALLDRRFLARLERGADPPPIFRAAVSRLTRADGAVSVSTLTSELGCSRHYLWSAFRDYVGVPPRVVGRLLRFGRAHRMLTGAPERRIGEVAHLCGYYDHAHLVRDFQQFAGYSPSALRANRLPIAGVAHTP